MSLYGGTPIYALVVLTSLACSESQAPSPDGPLFMTGSVDGVPWTAGSESGDLYALLGPQRVILAAQRSTVNPLAEERLTVEFATTDIFERTSYDLAADISGFATYQVFTSPPGGSAEVYYSTTRAHTGALTIQAVNVKDSVVTGTFVFDAVPLGPGSAVHHIAGQFRVRYVTTVP